MPEEIVPNEEFAIEEEPVKSRHPLIADVASSDLSDESTIDLSKGSISARFITGPAGSGKTYKLREEISADPRAGILCATTGVAAVNLGTTTINSVLKFFDTEDLTDQLFTGRLVRTLMTVAEDYRELMVDEVSMMEADQLDILVEGVIRANERLRKDNQLGLTLTGDFAQLPPVKGKWAFEASHWNRFASNIVRMHKIWRQNDDGFLNALNLARAGQGKGAAETLESIPDVKWAVATVMDFPGTTIVSKNDDVNKYNTIRYMKLTGKELTFKSARWGVQRKEWKNIPEAMNLKIGSFVMILTNAPKRDMATVLDYANGDQGIITEFAPTGVWVRLERTGQTHLVPFISRNIQAKELPANMTAREHSADPANAPYLDETLNRWILGGITYLPIRLAYAATVHKTQGLTLDSIQVDVRGHFFGSNNMCYVALSRVKSPKGLRIVGTPKLLEQRIKVAPEIKEWI